MCLSRIEMASRNVNIFKLNEAVRCCSAADGDELFKRRPKCKNAYSRLHSIHLHVTTEAMSSASSHHDVTTECVCVRESVCVCVRAFRCGSQIHTHMFEM